MTQKIYQSSLTATKNLAQPGLRTFLLSHKIRALRKGIIIPDDIIAELESFADRNSLPELENKMIKCCNSCLKAHAIKKSNEFGLEPRAITLLNVILDGSSIGHNGHYLDEEKVIEI